MKKKFLKSEKEKMIKQKLTQDSREGKAKSREGRKRSY